MTRFYYSTGRVDKSIKNKLYITESLIKEKECICVNNSYHDTDRKIIIKYFDTVFEFKSIFDLVEALKDR